MKKFLTVITLGYIFIQIIRPQILRAQNFSFDGYERIPVNSENLRALEYFNQAMNPVSYGDGGYDMEILMEGGVPEDKVTQLRIKNLSNAIRLDPHFVAAYFHRGISRAKLEKYRFAINDFSRVIELGFDSPGVYILRANAKEGIGQFESAIEDYNKAIELDPDESYYYANRGINKDELGWYQAAIEDYDKAIELDPDESYYYANRGVSKSELGWHQAAIEDYDKAIELDPDESYYYANRAVAMEDLGQYKPALEDINQAIELEPKNIQFFLSIRDDIVKKSKEELQQIPKTHIVCIGISTYENILLSQLDSPADNAYRMARLCERTRFVSNEVPVLTNQRATRDKILETIRNFLCNPDIVDQEDQVIFYFTGHGVSVGGKIGICPYNYYDQSNLISDEDILDVLNDSPARHKVCIIEACKNEIRSMSPINELDQRALQRFHQKRLEVENGLVFLTSSMPGSRSYEFPEIGGIFSFYLFEALEGEADKNGNQQINSRELYDYIRENVSRETAANQIPQINTEGYNLNLPIFQLR